MNQSLSVIFYPKKQKGYKEGPIPIYMRISVRNDDTDHRDVTELSTAKKMDVTKWSTQSNRLNGKTDQVKTVNEYLNLLEWKASNAQNQLIRLGQFITAEKIKLLIEWKTLEKERSIMCVFKEHNNQMLKLIGKDYAAGTLDIYDRTYRHTLAFMIEEYKVEDASISALNLDFLEKFEVWLKTIRNCDHNTAMKYLANFKKIVLICVKKKWLPGDPFSKVRRLQRVH